MGTSWLAAVAYKAAVAAGFDVADAIALLRLDDLYVEVFEVKDVKVRLMLQRLPAVYSCFDLMCPSVGPFGELLWFADSQG